MKSRQVDRESAVVVVPVDIHDIRVLTATGPIDLPAAAPGSSEPVRRNG